MTLNCDHALIGPLINPGWKWKWKTLVLMRTVPPVPMFFSYKQAIKLRASEVSSRVLIHQQTCLEVSYLAVVCHEMDDSTLLSSCKLLFHCQVCLNSFFFWLHMFRMNSGCACVCVCVWVGVAFGS